MRRWKEKAEGSPGGCSLAAGSVSPCADGGREDQGSHLAEAGFPVVTSGHSTRGQTQA